MKKNYQIIPCLVVPRISRKTFSLTFGQFRTSYKKENLQNNSHIQIIIIKIFGHGLSKKKLKQFNYKSWQNKLQKPNNLYLISTSHLRSLCPSQMTPLHSHRDNSYVANHSIHTPISVTNNLD